MFFDDVLTLLWLLLSSLLLPLLVDLLVLLLNHSQQLCLVVKQLLVLYLLFFDHLQQHGVVKQLRLPSVWKRRRERHKANTMTQTPLQSPLSVSRGQGQDGPRREGRMQCSWLRQVEFTQRQPHLELSPCHNQTTLPVPCKGRKSRITIPPEPHRAGKSILSSAEVTHGDLRNTSPTGYESLGLHGSAAACAPPGHTPRRWDGMGSDPELSLASHPSFPPEPKPFLGYYTPLEILSN